MNPDSFLGAVGLIPFCYESLHVAFLLALTPTSLFGIAGCGSYSVNLPAAAQSLRAVTSELLFTTAGAKPSLAAELLEKAGVVTGTGTVYACSSTPEKTSLSGTVSSGGKLTLETGALIKGLILTLQGQLNRDSKNSSNMTLSVSGAGCHLPAVTRINAQVYAPAQGSYNGNFVSSDGASTPVTATLSQNNNAGPGGSYALSGSVSFPNSSCLHIATINSTEHGNRRSALGHLCRDHCRADSHRHRHSRRKRG